MTLGGGAPLLTSLFGLGHNLVVLLPVSLGLLQGLGRQVPAQEGPVSSHVYTKQGNRGSSMAAARCAHYTATEPLPKAQLA